MPQTLTEQLSREQQIAALEKEWATDPRWKGVKRGYSAADVVRLRGSFPIEHTLAKRGAEKLWDKINGGAKKGYVNAFGAISAGQAMQQAKAGLEAVYLSGRVVVMSPRPGRITEVIDVDLGPRTEDVRESPEFFKMITRVREALRGIEAVRGIE